MKSYESLKLNDTQSNPFYYQNDLGITQIGDPFILKASDGLYYLFCTSSPSSGYYCWKSEDMVHWSGKNLCFTKESDSWCKDSFWAPEVVEYEGRYYMYYTASQENGSLRIGVAVSELPGGPYKDIKKEPLFDFGYAAIDANVLIDEDGSKYLYYSRDCSENAIGDVNKSEIYGVKLGDDMISVEGEPLLLATPEQDWELGSISPLWNEGPEVIRHENTYYLTYSANFFGGSSYSVGYATSDSPLGTYEKSDHNPILFSGNPKTVSGPGHHGFTTSPDGTELWMAYHTHTDPKTGGGNRKVNIDRVLFAEDGSMYVNGPTLCEIPIPSDGTYTNYAAEASIAGADNTKLLTDEIFTIHKKYSNYDCIVPVKDSKASITFEFSEPQEITDILLYKGVTKGKELSDVKAVLDDRLESASVKVSDDVDQRSTILSFDKQKVKKIELLLTPKEGAPEVAVSEISILGSN